MLHKKLIFGFLVITLLGAASFFLIRQKSEVQKQAEWNFFQYELENKIFDMKERFSRKIQGQIVASMENTDYYNTFTSRDQKLSFPYKKSWICKEVVYGEKVFCYPTARQLEEYDRGMDQQTVSRPNIAMEVDGCSANEETKPTESFWDKYLRNFNNCSVLIYDANGDFSSKEEMDNIIFTEDTLKSPSAIAKIPVIEPKQWSTYTNKEYGFAIDYPSTLNGYELKVVQEGNQFSIKGLNPVENNFQLPIEIGLHINDMNDLDKFIKDVYPDDCKLEFVDYKNPIAKGIYDVEVGPAVPEDPNSDEPPPCFVNHMGEFGYSPTAKKAVTMDFGQELPMSEKIEEEQGFFYVDYTHKTAASFRFTE